MSFSWGFSLFNALALASKKKSKHTLKGVRHGVIVMHQNTFERKTLLHLEAAARKAELLHAESFTGRSQFC